MAARLSSRLSSLSRDDLLELTIAGCAASDAVRSAADALLARRQSLPAWCVEGVLLSPDLLPHLMEPLQLQDCAVASVCTAWAAQWAAMLHWRRYVHPAILRRLPLPAEPFGLVEYGGRLCVGAGQSLHIVSHETGHTGHRVMLEKAFAGALFELVAHDDALFAFGTRHVVRLKLDYAAHMAAGLDAEGDRLFLGSRSRITVVDTELVQEVDYIGEGLLADAADCTVCGGELFVADWNVPGRLQVFDLTGTHRRTIRGDFYRPERIECQAGRLYLIEGAAHDDAEGACEHERTWAGRRLIVLEPSGKTQQVVRLPDALAIKAMCFLGNELFFADFGAEQVYVLRLASDLPHVLC